MSPKSIALLVVGMVLISGVFVFTHVDYPASPAHITIKPPKGYVPPQIYKYENYNRNGLGGNQTSFKDYGNSTIIMQGYAINESSKQVIANATMYSAVLEASTEVRTNSDGFYQIEFLQSGYGKFAFKIFQYNTTYTDNYLPLNATVWNNITFDPSPKYEISGQTLYNGSDVGDVGLNFTGPWGGYRTSSGSSGKYTLYAVSGEYDISAHKQGFSNVTSPQTLDVKDSSITGFSIDLISNNQTGAEIRGYSFNMLGEIIHDFSVHSSTTGQYATLSSSEYSVSADYGNNNLSDSSMGYQAKSSIVPVSSSPTYYNFTLASENPFLNSALQPTVTVPSLSSSFYSSYIDNNASHPQYSRNVQTMVYGNVAVNGTSGSAASKGLEVLTSVNGTYFIKYIYTTDTGYYSFNMSFPGSYNFTILSSMGLPLNLSGNLNGGSFNQNLRIQPSSSGIENIRLHTVGSGGQTLPGVEVNITSGQNGPSIYSNLTNGNGNMSLNLTSGNYSVHLSKPGYTNKSVSIVPGNNSLNESLSTVNSIGNSTSKWNGNPALPGDNGTEIEAGLRNSSLPTPTTVNYNKSSFILQLLNNSRPISDTPVAVFIYVNAQPYVMTGSTNGSGEITVHLYFGGTFTVLPETVDYNGTAFSVNTSQIPVSGHVFSDNMTLKLLYNLEIHLQNPYYYSGASPPPSGLSTSNYLLSVNYSSTYDTSSNITVVNYSLPGGKYLFNYTDIDFVPTSFNVSLAHNMSRTEMVTPYLVVLKYSSNVTFQSVISGPLNYGRSLNGKSTQYFQEQAGSISLSVYLGSNLANSSGNQVLDSASPVYTSYLNITNYTLSVNSKISLPGVPATEQYLNFTLNGSGQTEYISSIDFNSTDVSFSSYSFYDNTTNITGIGKVSGNDSLSFTNYFTIASHSKNNFSLKYYSDRYGPAPIVNVNYLVVDLS